MIETLLLNFHKKILSNYALVYKQLLINIFIVVGLVLLGSLCFIYYLIQKGYGHSTIVMNVTFFILIIGIILLSIFVIIPSMNLTEEFYKTEPIGTEWELFRLYLLKEYLISNKFIDNDNKNAKENKEKIGMIISLFQQKIDNRRKNKPFSILGSYFKTSIVFLIPIWAAFNNQIYFKEVTLNDGLKNIGIVLGYSLVLIFLFSMLKILKIQYIFLFPEYKLQEIISMLTQLQIIQNNDSFSQKHMPQDQKDKIKAIVKGYNYNKTKNKNKEKNSTSLFKKYSYFKWK